MWLERYLAFKRSFKIGTFWFLTVPQLLDQPSCLMKIVSKHFAGYLLIAAFLLPSLSINAKIAPHLTEFPHAIYSVSHFNSADDGNRLSNTPVTQDGKLAPRPQIESFSVAGVDKAFNVGTNQRLDGKPTTVDLFRFDPSSIRLRGSFFSALAIDPSGVYTVRPLRNAFENKGHSADADLHLITRSNQAFLPQPLTNNACEIIITNVDPGCNFNATTNESTYDVIVTVSWTFGDLATMNELINVAFEGQMLTIDPAGQVTGSGMVTFVGVNGPVENRILSAAFATSDCCMATSSVDLVSCVPACAGQSGNDLVGGSAFYDANNNGMLDAGETGQENVQVNVFDCQGNLVCEVFTNSNGDWCCNGAAVGDTFRIEYSTPFDPDFEESVAGPDNGSSIQFFQGGATNSSYAVTTPRIDCEGDASDFDIVFTCFAVGDNINGPNSNDPVILSNPYQERDPPRGPGTAQDGPEVALATAREVGSIYGVAVSPPTGDVYLSTYIKRYAGLGPGNVGPQGSTGAIYRIRPDGALDVLVDLDPNSSTNPDPSLYSTGQTRANSSIPDATNVRNDCDPAFNEVGRVGWGDIDISADGRQVYGMNMFDKSLYVFDTTGTIISRNPIPGTACGPEFLGCTGNSVDLRPMATAYNPANGLVYVGVVCSGESLYDLSTRNQPLANAELEGYVFTFDPVTTQYSALPVLTFPLTSGTGYTPGGTIGTVYSAWLPDNTNPAQVIMDNFATNMRRPFPIVSDIEFDGDALLIGIRDIQKDIAFGNNIPVPDGNGNCTTTTFPSNTNYPGAGGLVLRACPDGAGNLSIEVNGVCGGVAGYGLDNKPGDRMRGYNTFYEQNVFHNNSDYMGSIAILPGQGEILAPGNIGRNGTGIYYIDNETIYTPEINNISEEYDYSIVYLGSIGASGNFRKAAGLGDIEVLCTREPIVQIGNYVWVDDDADGLQDPCEPPLEGLTVKLYAKPTNGNPPELLATTMTNASGNYYFTGPGTTDGATWETGVADDVMQRDSAYLIVYCGDNGFDATDNTLEVDGRTLCVTPANATGGMGASSLNDSDATVQMVGTQSLPAYCVEAGDLANGSNHSFDAGFKPLPCPEVELQPTTNAVCVTATISLADLVVSVFEPNDFDYLWSTSGNGNFVDATGAPTTDYEQAVSYEVGNLDATNGVTLTLMTDPATLPPNCIPAADDIFVEVLDADCGNFFWNGN